MKLLAFIVTGTILLTHLANQPSKQALSSSLSSLSALSSTSTSSSSSSSPLDLGLKASDDPDPDPSPQRQCRAIHSEPDKCEFVKEHCADVAALIDYLYFCNCTMGNNEWLSYILVLIWLLLVLKVLGSTAERFFLPPLAYLSHVLRISDGVAGVTVFALGNGANDVFVSYFGLSTGDFSLVLGGLTGAGICLTSMVLGAVLLVAPPVPDALGMGGRDDESGQTKGVQGERISHVSGVVGGGEGGGVGGGGAAAGNANLRKDAIIDSGIRKQDFWRDSLVYFAATGLIAAIAQDHKIYLWESVLFLVLYVLYVLLVICRDRKQTAAAAALTESTRLLLAADGLSEPEQGIGYVEEVDYSTEDDMEFLEGISLPPKEAMEIFFYAIEWPFSVLRWLSIPSTDKKWGRKRRLLNAVSPFFMTVVFMVAFFDLPSLGATVTLGHTHIPVLVLVGVVSVCLTILMLLTSTAQELPFYHPVFGPLAFVSSISWLNIIAGEVVAMLQTLGIEFAISTGILGATVLAIGNSINDLVADTTVSRRGMPAMACGACFGAPLLTNMLGLGFGLSIINLTNYPEPFRFRLSHQLYLSWSFLLVSLVMSMVVFKVTKYKPPKKYGTFLVFFYVCFLVASVVVETTHA